MKSIIQKLRKIRYGFLSNMNIVTGKPQVRQPVLFLGKGNIVLGENVRFGYAKSPAFFSGYSHIEARTPETTVNIGKGTRLNNSCTIIAEGANIDIGKDCLIGQEVNIDIGKDCLIGQEVNIFSSDFHGLRDRSKPSKAPVTIGDNVFIGTRSMILKGVTIGSNSTIAAGAVVTKDVPQDTVAAGNPAKVIKELK